MHKFYLVEAIRRTTYIQNWIREKLLAHKLYFGREPNITHLRVFNNIAYVNALDEKQKKLEAKSEKCILVGYSHEEKGYKCYNPRTKQVRVSCVVIFDESTSWYSLLSLAPEHSAPIT